ncbi:hypothetical protein CAPTEDRAFT_228736 [Capitella teleta]|uniref:Uncharacterized protein n=1 Tax=Capitella teleta TaxID=283909 RepID=R7ULS9_CAPTE|nr:hypothetical protein CAPTEDRAFT_228736 [Capitella teleta]|eukprot:ELU07160.1 hypothetical protein CAPTEDRAFT_228736 [Capitella teleta]
MDELEPGEVVRDARNPHQYTVVAPPQAFSMNSSLAHRPQPNPDLPPPPTKTRGKFSVSLPHGWVRIDRLQMPFVMRGATSYISVRLIEEKILAKYPSDYPEALRSRPPLKSFYLTADEVERLNNLTQDVFDFTTKDLMVSLEDFQAFYSLVKQAFPRGIDFITGGWVQVNNSVVPYVNRQSQKMMPLCVLKYASRLLLNEAVEGEEPLSQECMYLNAISLKAGMEFTFDPSTMLVSERTLQEEEKGRVLLKELPTDNPFEGAVYCCEEDGEKMMKEEEMQLEDEKMMKERKEEERREQEKRREVLRYLEEEKRKIEEEARREEEKRIEVERRQVELMRLKQEDEARREKLRREHEDRERLRRERMQEELRQEELRRERERLVKLRLEKLRQEEAREKQQLEEFLREEKEMRREEAREKARREEMRKANEAKRQSEARTAASSTNQGISNVVIKPKEYRGKTVSCYWKDDEHFVLLEALSTVYFKGTSVRHFVAFVNQTIGEKIVTLTPAEEEKFIAFYNLPTKKLKHNKILSLKDFDSAFDSISAYMDKIGQKKRPLATANRPEAKIARQ